MLNYVHVVYKSFVDKNRKVYMCCIQLSIGDGNAGNGKAVGLYKMVG